MNEVTIFNNPEFGEIRTLETEDGKVLFCSIDVATALGYAKPNNAVSAHCRCALKQGVPHPQSPDKTIEMTFIPESDVYRLAFGSKLPTAEKFTDWVTEEVLPTIRKHGAYVTDDILEQSIRDPDYMIGILNALKEEKALRREAELTVSVQSQQIAELQKEPVRSGCQSNAAGCKVRHDADLSGTAGHRQEHAAAAAGGGLVQ